LDTCECSPFQAASMVMDSQVLQDQTKEVKKLNIFNGNITHFVRKYPIYTFGKPLGTNMVVQHIPYVL